MAAYLSPIGNEQQSDASGNPLSGGFIYTYIAGTSTLAATFTDAAGLIPQTNPIVLNASGLPASPIYINGGVSMKFIIQNSASVLQRTIDNIQGINDPEFTGATTEWVNYSGAPTFLTTTSFSLVGDQTLIFQVNRRIKTTNSGGTVYSTILTSSFGSGVTTITVSNDSGVLDVGLSNVQYALLEATNPSIPETASGKLYRTATIPNPFVATSSANRTTAGYFITFSTATGDQITGSTGTFTCSRPGVYCFTANFRSFGTPSSTSAHIFNLGASRAAGNVNSQVSIWYDALVNPTKDCSCSFVARMAVGDTVRPELLTYGSTGTTVNCTLFTGAFLSP